MTHDLDICSKLTSNLPEIQADNLYWKQKDFKVRIWSRSEFQFKLGLHIMTARCLYDMGGNDPGSRSIFCSRVSYWYIDRCITHAPFPVHPSEQGTRWRVFELRHKINSRWLISLLCMYVCMYVYFKTSNPGMCT